MKPLGKWVFVRRDPTERKHMGLEISEKALTKNLKGEITHAENKKLIGLRVHLPHYYVIDYKEYAIIKEDDLFAKLIDEKWVPIGGFVRVRKCQEDHYRDENGDIVLYRTDRGVEYTNWVEIIDVSDECRHVCKEDIGLFCVAPEEDDKLRRLEYSKDYMMHENLIQFVTSGE